MVKKLSVEASHSSASGTASASGLLFRGTHVPPFDGFFADRAPGWERTDSGTTAANKDTTSDLERAAKKRFRVQCSACVSLRRRRVRGLGPPLTGLAAYDCPLRCCVIVGHRTLSDSGTFLRNTLTLDGITISTCPRRPLGTDILEAAASFSVHEPGNTRTAYPPAASSPSESSTKPCGLKSIG